MHTASSPSRRLLFSLAAAALALAPLSLATVSRADTPVVKPIAPAFGPATTEQEIDQKLEGKFLFLRGFYLEDKLEFDTTGKIVGAPQKGSFTLSGLEVKKVRANKKSIVIEGDRIGLHFFGGLPYEDDSKPFERIKVSKKPVEITIDRLVIEPEKKKKKKDLEKEKAALAAPVKRGVAATATAPATYETSGVANPPDVTFEDQATTTRLDVTAQAPAAPLAKMPVEPVHPLPKDSWIQLSKALNVVFAPGLDESVIATLPDYWQVYFATKAGKTQVARMDNSVLRPGSGVVSPRLLSSLDPASNDYAQKANIAGMTLLSTIVGASGEPSQVAIVRPIGFGLDEEAVKAVERAKFRPGLRDGQPVPVAVNLEVTFRIYSNATRPQPGAPVQSKPAQAVPPANPAAPQSGKASGKELAVVSPR